MSEPLFALFCRPIIDFKKTNFTIIIIILRKTSIFSNAHTHIYIVSLFSLLVREWWSCEKRKKSDDSDDDETPKIIKAWRGGEFFLSNYEL